MCLVSSFSKLMNSSCVFQFSNFLHKVGKQLFCTHFSFLFPKVLIVKTNRREITFPIREVLVTMEKSWELAVGCLLIRLRGMRVKRDWEKEDPLSIRGRWELAERKREKSRLMTCSEVRVVELGLEEMDGPKGKLDLFCFSIWRIRFDFHLEKENCGKCRKWKIVVHTN